VTHCRRHWRAVAGRVMGTILLLTVLTVSPATAQSLTDLRLERAHVSVWPEYDDPRVLILYEGAFVDDGGFPQTVEFPVPLGIDVNQAAGLTPDGRYLRQPYQIIPEDGYALLRYELPVPTFFFEYYYDPIEGETDKTIDWWLRTSYPITDLQVDVQQPLNATGFTVSPAADLINIGQDGFKHHLFSHRTLDVGEELKLHISYTKADLEPSVTRQPFVEPGAAALATTTPTPNQGLNPAALLIVVGAAGLLAGGGYWYLNRQRADDLYDDEEWEAPRRARRPRRAPDAETVTGYCHQCGKGLRADDRFCPGCGTRRRQA
jgi:hypothetical protein